jgi:hypothetical protein
MSVCSSNNLKTFFLEVYNFLHPLHFIQSLLLFSLYLSPPSQQYMYTVKNSKLLSVAVSFVYRLICLIAMEQ